MLAPRFSNRMRGQVCHSPVHPFTHSNIAAKCKIEVTHLAEVFAELATGHQYEGTHFTVMKLTAQDGNDF